MAFQYRRESRDRQLQVVNCGKLSCEGPSQEATGIYVKDKMSEAASGRCELALYYQGEASLSAFTQDSQVVARLCVGLLEPGVARLWIRDARGIFRLASDHQQSAAARERRARS